MKNTYTFRSIIIIFVLVLVTLFTLVGCGTQTDDIIHDDYSQSNKLNAYQLVRVVDGDTLVVIYNNKETKVRMIGVNCPESVAQDESRNTKEGKIASDYTKSLLSNSTVVYLEFDEDLYDQYDRLLAYVYTEDGEMVNELLLEMGYARTMFYAPNYKYQSRLESAEKSAQKSQAGFWPTKSGRDALYG